MHYYLCNNVTQNCKRNGNWLVGFGLKTHTYTPAEAHAHTPGGYRDSNTRKEESRAGLGAAQEHERLGN